MIRVLVSSCLLGEPVRYDGSDASSTHPVLEAWRQQGRLVPFCPEVAGGFGIPRPRAEIQGGGGGAVLDGDAAVVDEGGANVTSQFLRGAEAALTLAREHGVGLAVLKDGSPSCASEQLHDGSFSGTRSIGRGVTAELLERGGIRVFSEARLAEAAALLEQLESQDRPSSSGQEREHGA